MLNIRDNMNRDTRVLTEDRMDHRAKAIGGYFELELPFEMSCLYAEAQKFQSGRGAFRALLDAGRPSRVWMPKYICDSMLAPLRSAGIETVFYDIDRRLDVAERVAPRSGDWLLYVNYFGVCAEQEERLLQRFNPSQLVLDHSQAFFSPPAACLGTVFSPRKFFGVPDGGLLMSTLSADEVDEVDNDSVGRCSHLLKRLGISPEAGYRDFEQAENSLSAVTPLKMSRLSERMLTGIDYRAVRLRRNQNFRFLHEQLGHLNELELDCSSIDGPLCYPLLIDDHRLRGRLLADRVFVATYWPEVRERVAVDSFERRLVDKCLPLPCDQRYNAQDLVRVCDTLLANQKG